VTADRPGLRPLLVSLAGVAVATLLAGCGSSPGSSAASLIGYDRSVPDEFAVLARAPLEMPPDFTSLPRPTPGAPRPQEPNTREVAESIVLGGGAVSAQETGTIDGGEASLLAQAGAAASDPSIRTTVDEEAYEANQQDERLVDRLLFWQSAPLPGTVVNPYLESQRLASNAQAGLPVTEGETPIVIRRRRAPLEGLFVFN
jgi:hypothetical protein